MVGLKLPVTCSAPHSFLPRFAQRSDLGGTLVVDCVGRGATIPRVVVKVAIFVVVMAVTLELGLRLGAAAARRQGASPEALRRARHIMLLSMPPMAVLAALIGWTLTSGHAAVGLGLLGALVMLNAVVMPVLHYRRAQRRARERRERASQGA